MTAEFSRDGVFIDIDSIPIGSDFPTVLNNVLGQCRIVLVVIGPDWATVTEPNGALLIVVGRFLGKEAAELLPHFSWSNLGPRRPGLRSFFRIMLLALAAWMFVGSAAHHLYNGPRTLWMSRGNPFVQRYIDGPDPAELAERQSRADDDKEKMNGEPPRPTDPEYGEYERQCLHPYLAYYSYSFVMFVLVAPVVLTVCFYTVCSSLWNHLITQPREIAELPDDANPRAVDNRLRYFEATYVDDIDRYLALLLLLLCSWAYHLWWDQYNLTATAAGLREASSWWLSAPGSPSSRFCC